MFDIWVPPTDREAARQIHERISNLTKPLGSLGRIEELAERLAAIAGGPLPSPYPRRAIVVGAGDHGVTAEGVSAYPSEVTAQMISAFLGEFAAINAFARMARAEVYVADFGVAGELVAHPRLLDAKVGRGTGNLACRAAMSESDVDAALAAGLRVYAEVEARAHPQVIALGDMGIGNTTSAAALICAFTGETPEAIVGRGTGLDDDGIRRKIAVVERALQRVGEGAGWRRIAAELGGYEIVGIAGVLLGAAAARTPILLDGFIVAAAALLARAIAPNAIEYCIAAHRSRENGHALALRALGLSPLLDLDLRLGEASGAALAFPLIEAAARMVCEMKTFAEAGVATAHEPIEA